MYSLHLIILCTPCGETINNLFLHSPVAHLLFGTNSLRRQLRLTSFPSASRAIPLADRHDCYSLGDKTREKCWDFNTDMN